MNIQTLAEEFWEQGYLVIENFFDADLMDTYQQYILEHFAKNSDYQHNEDFLKRSKTDVIPWFPQNDGIQAFDIAQQNKKLVALCHAILGDNWTSLYSMVMFSLKDSQGQAWHQDCPPENNKQYNLNRLVYTMDINSDTGGETLVVPGSHKSGAISVGDVNEDFPEQLVLTPKKGTLVLLHGHTWHRVLPVKGDYRVSTNYRCCPANTPDDITDICVYRNMRYQFSTSMLIEDRLK